MAITPNHLAIKTLFEHHATFEVPKYQRGYAWEDEAITDFIDDISRSLTDRLGGKPRDHFFGGIVAARKDVPDSSRSNHEVIDGQQRLASFVMLAAALVRSMTGVVDSLKNTTAGQDKKAKTYLTETIEALRGLYLSFRDSIKLEYVQVPKLTLSQADNEFFQSMLTDAAVTPKRDSHKRLQEAWRKLKEFVDHDLLGSLTPLQKANKIKILVDEVLAKDCTGIFMRSDTKGEAYRIFQVLNDRGVSLTDGDLLRARTLELLDDAKVRATQDEVATCWDSVLAYSPGDIGSYLQWYFSSHEGQRPKPSVLVDQYLEARFKRRGRKPSLQDQGKKILEETKQMDRDFLTFQTLGKGEWPYTKTKVTNWDRERLRMLVTHLEHTNAMPLLLALTQLDEKAFNSAVASLERFVFRYKTIGNVHIGKMTKLYLKHATGIRASAKGAVKNLKRELRTLVMDEVPDDVFKAKLAALQYQPRGGNASIRYFLITLEDHLKWFENGAQGEPKCVDKTRVFDLSGTTLEHIYPLSSSAGGKDADLEEVKQTLGNLTILGPGENDKLANKPFAEKRTLLAASSMRLNTDIAKNMTWTKVLVEARTNRLVEMALKVFIP